MVTQRGYQLDVAVLLPSESRNSDVRGLLGNFNGLSDDDLLSRSGHTVNNNCNM